MSKETNKSESRRTRQAKEREEKKQTDMRRRECVTEKIK